MIGAFITVFRFISNEKETKKNQGKIVTTFTVRVEQSFVSA